MTTISRTLFPAMQRALADQRVIVITAELTAVEIIRRDTTSEREWRRMKRKAGLF